MKPAKEIQNLTFLARREYERVPFVKRLTVLDIQSGRKYDANGIDISVKGIGFFSKKFFSKNSRISIQVWLDNEQQKNPVWLEGTVKWSKLEQDGAIIGVQFDNIIKSAHHPKLFEFIYNITRLLILALQ